MVYFINENNLPARMDKAGYQKMIKERVDDISALDDLEAGDYPEYDKKTDIPDRMFV